ncbi:MAG: 30S ribosome-binding factor RbfA [Kiritimatiellaeota bacterium]|nr:30S ribosome-binding factor RbfA [Kiritimatiellota bacterium]
MAIDRIKRINEMIRREIAAGLLHTGQGEDLATGKISVVSADVSRDLRGCAVLVSIMAEPEEAARLMTWLRRHRADFQDLIAKNIALKYTPKIFFKQTGAIEKGDHVLDILDKLPVAPED